MWPAEGPKMCIDSPGRWGGASKGFIEGGVNLEREKISICTPPPVVSSARKGKKAERSSDEDAKLVAARQGLRVKIWPAKKKVSTPLI